MFLCNELTELNESLMHIVRCVVHNIYISVSFKLIQPFIFKKVIFSCAPDENLRSDAHICFS
jgi:hypothetical protein